MNFLSIVNELKYFKEYLENLVFKKYLETYNFGPKRFKTSTFLLQK